MKATPQNTISGWGAAAGEQQRVADVVRHVLDLAALVGVGQDDRPALLGQLADLGLECGDCAGVRRGRDLDRQGGSRTLGRAGHGIASSEKSRASAECVSAPIEM
jgi:hypothetical protein